MNRNRWTVPALLSLALAAPALAGPGGGYPGRAPGGEPRFGPGGHGPGGHGPTFGPEMMEELFDARADRIAELLDLSTDQRAAFDKTRTDALDAARPKMERMRQGGDELRALLEANAPDAAAVGGKVIEMHRLKGELRAARKAVEGELVRLLTPEQKFAFDALKEARRDVEGRGSAAGPGHGPRFGDRLHRPAPPSD